MPQYPYYQYGINNGVGMNMNPMPNNMTYFGQNFGQNNQPAQMTPPTIHADIIQVDDENQAKEYNIATGCTQMFMSKDDKKIFIKSAYANGSYDFIIYTRNENIAPTATNTQNGVNADMTNFITRDEFEKRLSEISYKSKYNNNKSRRDREDHDDE